MIFDGDDVASVIRWSFGQLAKLKYDRIIVVTRDAMDSLRWTVLVAGFLTRHFLFFFSRDGKCVDATFNGDGGRTP